MYILSKTIFLLLEKSAEYVSQGIKCHLWHVLPFNLYVPCVLHIYPSFIANSTYTLVSWDSYPTLPCCCSRYGANVGSDIRYLYSVNIVVSFDHVVEAVFPMHCYFRVAVLIRKKESGISVYYSLAFWLFPVLDDYPETLCHVLHHGQQ